LIITHGSSGGPLARAISKIAGFPLIETSMKRFPDGELYLRVMGEPTGQDVVVVQSLGLRPDRLLMEYCMIAEALKGAGCRSVTAVIPYLAYARQDSRFHPGEPLSVKLVARMIEVSGTDRLISVDAHLHRLAGLGEVFTIPTVNLTAMPLLAEYYRDNYGSENAFVVGPDSEAEQWAKTVSRVLSVGYGVLSKERLGDRDVRVSGSVPVKGKRVILVDDIVSTGGTLAEAIRGLRSIGAKRVDVLVTHALLTDGALPRLRRAGMSHLVSTDSVRRSSSKVSLAPLIAGALKDAAGSPGGGSSR
jgi:ribose-phosphate pyrophosphokinase